jgi:hypothetical protein
VTPDLVSIRIFLPADQMAIGIPLVQRNTSVQLVPDSASAPARAGALERCHELSQ